jgi:hypothetical protein
MKPCPKNREGIALLAMDALDVQRERELSAHLADCAGCRHYLEQISSVAGTLRAAEPESRSQPSASFHRDVLGALAAAQRDSAGEMLLAKVWSVVNWRLALPALTAVALVIAAWWVTARRADKPAPAPLALRAVAKPDLKTELEPTFSNYEIAAHQSLDKLDELLTEQGNRMPAPPAVSTTAWRPLSNMAE